MSADTVQTFDPGMYLNVLPEELNVPLALQQPAAKCTHSLVADKQDRTFRTPQIMLEMMAYPSRIAHSGSRNDHFRLLDKIDHLRFIARGRSMKSGKYQRIDARIHKFQRFAVKTVPHIHRKHFGCLDRQRTVQIHIEIPVFRQKIIFLDLPDEIEHLLGPAHGKGRDDHIAAPVKCLLDDPCKFTDIVRLLRSVYAVAVCGLHNHIIRCIRIARILDDRLIDISHISGKNQFFRHISLGRPHFDTG